MSGLRVFFRLVRKDLVVEFRGKRLWTSGLAFGVLLLVVMGIALNGASGLPADWSAGVLWLCVFFATAQGMSGRDRHDGEMGAWDGLMLAPVDRSLVFYARWAALSAFVLAAEAALVVAFFVIFNQPPPLRPGWFAGVMAAGAVALTGVSSFVATLSAASAMRDILVPVLLFPLAIPLFLAVIRLTVFSLQPAWSVPWVWVEVLAAYAAAFLLVPWLLFEPLMEV
ncbi:MAG: heme exporter protein CcmB [Alicyclobacillaceae bacterium]|nr:heme exporter protein CcmB [Alicyclobacillaceae bacterium]